ncbi:uncharacterized protein JCM15063_004982 [Sporobolomyces koalae]|uniref:uncharacterized protein n=1 Tax=Sporobolomyces koalae TaxID=500713 RepID=UPI00317B24EE
MTSPFEGFRYRSPLSEGTGRPASPATPTSISPTSPTRSGFALRTTPRAQHPNLHPIHVPSQPSSDSAVTSPNRPQTHRSLAIPSPSSPATVIANNSTVPLARPAPSSYPTVVPSRAHVSTPPPRVHGSTSEHRAAPTISYSQSLSSPCFIHSHLDHTLAELQPTNSSLNATASGKKVRTKSTETATDPATKGDRAGGKSNILPIRDQSNLAGSFTNPGDSNDEAIYSDADYNEDDDDEERINLTRQLAETAVSVREMSKQLGRARVITQIQSVMIVTKARDNQLTRLTRELALWLMQTPRNGKDRGLIVYVDSQLKKSKRFDAAGIERDHPELFRPFPSHRRYSRTSSSASLATDFNGHPRRSSGPTGTSTPGGSGISQLSMTNLNEALLKRNNSISSASGASDRSEAHPARKGEQGQEGQLRYWTNDMCRKSPHLFDFVITLGGDGTVLYTSWLFQQIVPPVIPFALGSLGFLTNFDFSNFRSVLDTAIKDGIRVNLRMRFTCTVYRAVNEEDPACRRRAVKSGKTGGIFMKSLTREGWDALESGKLPPPRVDGSAKGKDKEIKCFSTRAVESFEVLNDLVVDRGPSPYVSQLELFGDEHHMTTVQADGLTVSTPTGSTAYSLSAGGSLVHPEIPAILITPICPHTLSFRPMLLPDSMELRICVPYNSRSTAWASFDGRGRVELRQGDHIKVTASPYPFPTVCADKQSTDWFGSIQRTLRWNERQRQKSFVILEEGRKKSKEDTSPVAKSAERAVAPNGIKKQSRFASPSNDAVEDDDDCATSVAGDGGEEEEDDSGEDDEEEEEEYDIDDISESNTTNASSPNIPPGDPASTVPPLPLFSNTHSEPSTPTLTPAFASAPAPREFERVSSGSSNVSSVDIQDDGRDRFRDPRPKARAQSRARSQDTMRRALERSAERQSIGPEARAFAVVGMDSDSSHSGSDHE